MLLNRFRYQVALSLLYVWLAGTGPITGLPLSTATLLYMVAMCESYIPSLLRSAMRGFGR